MAANPNDMILFRKCSAKLNKKDIKADEQDFGQVGEIFRFEDVIIYLMTFFTLGII